MTENEISKIAFDFCFKIHRRLGPGLFEVIYEEVFCYELEKLNIPYLRQVDVPVVYEQIFMEKGFKADVIVAGKIL